MQDTGTSRTNLLDQYYTAPSIAKKCIDIIVQTISDSNEYYWIEPSAGAGSFSNQVPSTIFSSIAYDISPKSDNIVKQDFLEWNPTQLTPLSYTHTQKILLYGNPPFGRQSKLARAFIKKGCEFVDVIAFILPKSFQKPSMQTAFSKCWHCVYNGELEPNAFVINDNANGYDVPCVFQIWKKEENERPDTIKDEPDGFYYVKYDLEPKYDMAFRRVGVNAGKTFTDVLGVYRYNSSSHYFLKFDEKYGQYIQQISEKINEHVFPSNTVGPRSLSKPEVNTVVNQILRGFSEYAPS